MESLFAKLSFETLPPLIGQVSSLNANTTAATQDLAAIGPNALDMRNEDALPVAGGSAIVGSATPSNQNLTMSGCIGRFIQVYADGADVGVLFASNTFSNVTTAANLAASNANGAGCCVRIANATYRTWFIHPAARYMSYVGAANCNVRISVVSRTG